MAKDGPHKDRIGQLGDIGSSHGSVREHRQWTAEERAKMAEVAASPAAQAWVALGRQVLKRGPLAVVLVDEPLPNDAIAIVHLGAPAPLTRYFVTSVSGFTDDVLISSRGLALAYQMQHPDDEGSVTLTLYRDGRVDRVSEKIGTEIGGRYRRAGQLHPDDYQSRAILEQAASITPETIPGVGHARVYRFK